ncbi:hypothetical protein PAPYR_10641 [Paratrimastix pyriformis]|uniref:TmcB/TmcC TPR repeats domain-containing protein n=1 Tax=Paratrimastix pyriformis TaxID=342808 RepID=A0ABQ8U999_9EUKA|nr:hypothetical protein PAPYR_10641 [Paratrimastix pyriformis]
MNPARGEDWLSRFERGIFGIFYLLRVDSPFPRTKTILWVISALQLFFLTVTVPSAFAQTPWFSIPRSILDFTFASTQTAMYVSFGVCSFFLVAFSVSAVLLGVVFQKEDSAILLACWGMHAVPSAVAILMLVLFVLAAPPLGLCKGLLVVAMRVLTAHTELRSIAALGTTAIMVGSVLIGLPYRGLFATVLSVGMYWVSFLGALESALLWFVLPQYTNSWVPFVGLLGVAALTTPFVAWFTVRRYRRAVALTPAHVRQLAATPTLGATSAATGSFGAAGPLGLALNPAGVGLGPDAMQPAATTATTAGPLGSEGTSQQPVAPVTPLATSLLYLQLAGVPAPEQLVARCRWAPAVEWATRFLNWEAGTDPRLVSYAEAIYNKGLARFPKSHGLLLNYAEFLLAVQHNSLASINAVRRAAGLPNAALDTRFAVYAAERDYESQSTGTEGGLRSHVMSMLALRRSMRQAQSAHKRAKAHVKRVWSYLLRPSSDMRQLPPLLDSAVSHANAALEAYSSLLQSFPTSVPLLRGYGSLLQDLYGDIELADNLFAQADQLEEDGKAAGVGDDTGSVQSGGAGPAKGTRAALDAGSHKAPSMAGTGTGGKGGPAAGGSRLSSMDNGTFSIARQSVVSFLVNRHAAAEESEEAEGAGGAVQSLAQGGVAASRTGWLLFLVHVLALGLCIYFTILQYQAITASYDTGITVQAIGNCSILAERIAYEGRQVLELMMQNSDPPLEELVVPSPLWNMTNRVLLAGDALARYEWLRQRLYVHGQTLFDTIYANGAKNEMADPWMTSKNPVLIATITEGTITAITQDTMNLTTRAYLSLTLPTVHPTTTRAYLSLTLPTVHPTVWCRAAPAPDQWLFSLDYAGKARLIGQTNATDLKCCRCFHGWMLVCCSAFVRVVISRHATPHCMTLTHPFIHRHDVCFGDVWWNSRDASVNALLHLVLNGPLVLGPALANMSLFTASAASSASDTMMLAPAFTGGLAGLYLVLAGVVAFMALACLNKERKAVLAIFLTLPRDGPTGPDDDRSSGVSSPTLSPADRPEGSPPPICVSVAASDGADRLESRHAPAATLPTVLPPHVPLTPDSVVVGPMPDEATQHLDPALEPLPEGPLSQLLAITLDTHPEAAAPPSPATSGRQPRGLRKRYATSQEEADPVRNTLSDVDPAGDNGPGTSEEAQEAVDEVAKQGSETDAATAARLRQLKQTHVLSRSITVRVIVALVLVAGFLVAAGLVGYQMAASISSFQTQVAASGPPCRVCRGALANMWVDGQTSAIVEDLWTKASLLSQLAGRGKWIRLSRLAVTVNLVQQLVFNKTLPYSPSERLTTPEQRARVTHWLVEDPKYAIVKTDRAMLRGIVAEAMANFTIVHRALTDGGVFEGIVVPLGLRSLAARDQQWFELRSCWMNDQALCLPGRLKNWPQNSTLSNLLSSFTQAEGHMIQYDDAARDLLNQDFEFIDSAFHWDLHDGLERITSLYHEALNLAVSANLSLEMILFGVAMASMLFAFLFLFRVNLIKGELTKTALMKALLPKAAFLSLNKTSWDQVQPMNVKEIDDLHATLLDTINQARAAIAQMKPHQLVLEAFEGLHDALLGSFDVEEVLMAKYNAPQAAAHRADHNKYRQGVRAALEALRAGQPEGLAQARAVVADSSYPLSHVPKFDVPLGRYLNRRGLY